MKSTNELTAPISNWMNFGTKGKLNIIIAFANFQCRSSRSFRIMAIPSWKKSIKMHSDALTQFLISRKVFIVR